MKILQKNYSWTLSLLQNCSKSRHVSVIAVTGASRQVSEESLGLDEKKDQEALRQTSQSNALISSD